MSDTEGSRLTNTDVGTRTHAQRITEAGFVVGNEAAIVGALEVRDREIEALRNRVGWEVAERDRGDAEVRRLTDTNQRLTDLVRHQRSELHTAGLLTDAEYADLAGMVGSPARLEGYDMLRGDRDALAAGLDAISDILDGMLEGASRTETKEALYTAVIQAWDTAARGTFRPNEWWRPFAQAHAAHCASHAVATARFEGARVMRAEAIRIVGDRFADTIGGHDVQSALESGSARMQQTLREIHALDPATVGSGSVTVPLSSDDGEALMRLGWSVDQLLSMDADDARAKLANHERPATVGGGS